MSPESIWPWVLISLDLAAVWLLARPSFFGNNDWNRFLARLAAGIFLSMQIAYWVERSKNTRAEPVMHWFSIAFGMGAVAFLGYHFVRLFTSESALQVESPERRYLLPESEEDARVRYRAAWQKYRRLRVLCPLSFLGWLPFAGVLGLILGLFGQVGQVVWLILSLAWLPFMTIFISQWAFWKCPRCGFAFKGPLDTFFPKRCQYCDLPKWAESPDA